MCWRVSLCVWSLVCLIQCLLVSSCENLSKRVLVRLPVCVCLF